MAVQPEAVRTALRGVLFPKFRRDVVTLGMVADVAVDGSTVTVTLRPGSDDATVREALDAGVRAALRGLPQVETVVVRMAPAAAGRGRDPFADRAAIPGVRHVVAVASGKGGVGKSTVAANLAVALAAAGGRVGLLDADVYGPSVPIMFGTTARPRGDEGGRIEPLEVHGVRLMSIGFFLDERSPVMWRGPLVMGIVRQFLHDVDWGGLDHLVVDLPPGTGDAPLTLVQQVPLSGGIVVTTPQDVALLDVGRGLAMLEQVSVPVLGIVENMAGYVCPACGHEDPVFGTGGADGLARHFEVPLLARLPLAPALREQGDAGAPLVVTQPGHPVSEAFRRLAARIAGVLEDAPVR
jgi:ATP-binding protein involved in chromosome partitioning